MAYIGNFPISVGTRAVNFKQNTATKKTETASGRIIRATNSTTIWSATLSFPTMTVAEFKPIQAFIARCQGSLNEFDIVLPTISTSTSSYVGSMNCYVTSDASAGATTLPVNSNVISDTLFKAGDVIRFGNHTKVYMVSTDINTDGGGNATLNITPALVNDVTSQESAGGEQVIFSSVPFRMILTGDLQEFGYRNDGLVDYEIDIQETI